MTNYDKLFSDELTNWLVDETGLNKSKSQRSVF